ncbi:MAG: hypothetical protein WC738_03725 [Candidatus Omnitrophota bacterium]|jgi:hypothetical protein
MLPEITKRLAYNYSEVRRKAKLSGSQDGDYFFAERTIGRILAGFEPLSRHGWLLSDTDQAYIRHELLEIHGRCYSIHHDIVHWCEKINTELDQGNIRPAQELLDKFIEQGRVGMLLEMKHGQ